MAKKSYTYVVTVTKTDFNKVEDEVFEYEYEAEPGESIQSACYNALSISAGGCSDED